MVRNFYKSYLGFEAYRMNFPEFLIKKYFLIISNIYYFCIKASCKQFKEDHLDSANLSKFDFSKLGQFSNIYKKKLKDVRKKVMDAFKISHQYNNVSTKLLLRMLPNYFDINSNFRKKTVIIKRTVDELLFYLEERQTTQEILLEKIDKIVNYFDDIQTEVFNISLLL